MVYMTRAYSLPNHLFTFTDAQSTYIICVEIGEVVFVQPHCLRPRRIGCTFEYQLQIVESTVSLTIREFGQCFKGQQSVLYITQ